MGTGIRADIQGNTPLKGTLLKGIPQHQGRMVMKGTPHKGTPLLDIPLPVDTRQQAILVPSTEGTEEGTEDRAWE